MAELPKDDAFGMPGFIILRFFIMQRGRAASSKGGWYRLREPSLGGCGEPMNIVTEKAVDEIIDKQFK